MSSFVWYSAIYPERPAFMHLCYFVWFVYNFGVAAYCSDAWAW